MQIVFEDDYLMVLNKPAGMVVNRAETVSTDTVQDWVEKSGKLVGSDELFVKRSGIAHRLDKETSGCLLVAKDPETLKKLLGLFKNREIHKEYLALVHGKLDPKEGEMSLPIKRDWRDREKWVVSYEGRSAQTAWKVERYMGEGDQILTLVRLFPKTGRTHQIRVHMTHLGHPLFADERYLGNKRREADRQKLSRHFLHAAALEFVHPVTLEKMHIEAPLPKELADVLI